MFQGSLFIWYNNVWSRFLCYKYTGVDYLASTKHIVEGESIFLFLLHCFFFPFFFLEEELEEKSREEMVR